MKTYTDEDVLRYVDGDMDEKSAQQLRADINVDPALGQRVDAMLASQLPYSMAYKRNPPPPIPDDVRKTIRTWTGVARNAPAERPAGNLAGSNVAAVVAAVGLSFALGFGAATWFNPGEHIANGGDTVAGQTGADAFWVKRVADYQSLYVAETVNNVQDGRNKADALLATEDVKNALDAHIPDLSKYHYQFVRAQLLGFDNQPLIQLVYTKSGRKPLALCFMPSTGDENSNITLVRHENLESASWRTSTQRFVIVADEPADSVKAIAQHAQASFVQG